MTQNEPKAKMGLNEPKWTQKTLHIRKMILYEPKTGLNEHKWVLMSTNFSEMLTSDAYPV